MKRLLLSLLLLICPSAFSVKAQPADTYRPVPRMRVIIDNDFSGDPDGLFQLAHHLLSPSVEVCGIVGSHVVGMGGHRDSTATQACRQVRQLLQVMGVDDGRYRVCQGSNQPMTDMHTPQPSEGARLIVEEAMRTDTSLPLYIVCGASLTTLASAYLMEPRIAQRLTLVWIGGQEYDGEALPPPGYSTPEYNLGLCIPAAQTVFNLSQIPIWQVPRDAYRQCICSLSELQADYQPLGDTGRYLVGTLTGMMRRLKGYGMDMGEVYVLGDSPLVLLTALQTGFEPDPASSAYTLRLAPLIADDGTYRHRPDGRPIRVYHRIDCRLMLGDLRSKLILFNTK